MQKKKAKVDGIYPLSFLQKALLFHSLQEKSDDQGFLQVKCFLNGRIDLEAFKKSWQQNINRHESLRTSIHWENIEKPVQVVHKEAKLPFIFYDWSEHSEVEQETKINKLKESDASERLNLSDAPVLRIYLIKLAEEKHFLLWSCHHILADGWSASIILQNLLEFYDANVNKSEINLPPIPSYKSYLNWTKKQDKSKVETFWTEYLKNIEAPTLIGEKGNLADKFEFETVKLSKTQSQKLKEFSRKNQITLNTLIQGGWAILLNKYTQNSDILFGTIVSGRSIDLPNAELMAGMFMNILPLRIKIDEGVSFSDWLKKLQTQQTKIRNFEYVNLDEIQNLNSNNLFDSLVVFENIPLENLSGGGITVKNFESGLTSNYPLTLAVNPSKEIECYLKYNSNSVSERSVKWWAKNLNLLLDSIDEFESYSVSDLTKKVSVTNFSVSDKKESLGENNIEDFLEEEHIVPRNKIELELAKIWENLIGKSFIGVKDNFFEIGGKSLTAVKMFAQIEKTLGKSLSPTVLLQHPTIEELAEQIQKGSSESYWKSIVPIRPNGSKAPVFCIHAAGAHIFHYRLLATYLDKEQPVYGVQAVGLSSSESPHESVEEMASHYLSEIRKIQSVGPYNFVGYCFSNAVCVEMAAQLRKQGEENCNLIIVDTEPLSMETDTASTPRLGERVKAYYQLIRGNNLKEIYDRVGWKIKDTKRDLQSLINKKNTREQIAENADSEQERQYLSTLNVLVDAYTTYEWKSVDNKVLLILTGSFETRPWANVVKEKWELIAKGGVDFSFVEGNHSNLFEEPYVQGLARQMQKYLDMEIEAD